MRHPFDQLFQRHFAGFRQSDPTKFRCTGCLRQPASAALRADFLLQKLLHPLHALFVLYFCQSIFYGVYRIVIGKIQLSCLIGFLCFVKNMLFLCRTVIDDILFFIGQIFKRNVGAHAHLPADVSH